MLQKIVRDGVILVVGCVLLWFVLSKLIPAQKPLNNLVSAEQEEKLAEYITDLIETQYTVIQDTAWTRRFGEIMSRFEKQMPDSDYEYKIKILDNEIPNAFATLDGNIYFFKGMLDLADKPEEIAAVLAHEIAHVEKKHVMNKLISEFGLTIITTVATGGDMVLAREMILMMTRGAFSRRQEKEADDFALKLLYDSGINPKYLGTLFRKLKEEHPESASQIEIMSSHPDLQSRIKKSLEYSVDGFKEVPLDSLEVKFAEEGELEN
jgi:predicted Zn-dependent protease